jgi:hypothetical protein
MPQTTPKPTLTEEFDLFLKKVMPASTPDRPSYIPMKMAWCAGQLTLLARIMELSRLSDQEAEDGLTQMTDEITNNMVSVVSSVVRRAPSNN